MSRSQPAESALIGREVDLLDLWRTLRTENVRLSGARRIGKTELLKHMRSDSRDGWTCLRIDLQGARDEPEAAGRAAQAFQGIGTAVDPRPSFAATLEQAIDRTVRRRRTKRLIVALDGDGFAARYVAWEFGLLGELGFGLDLSCCAATGAVDELVYVSPRSGQAVSRSAGAPYRDKLLPLPAFLQGGEATAGDILGGFRLTGYFLDRHVFQPHGRHLPDARDRFVGLMRRSA